MTNNVDAAKNYLAKFAHLMRQSLDNSDMEVITLEKEIEFLEDYLFINKKLRFDAQLDYSVFIDEEIEEDDQYAVKHDHAHYQGVVTIQGALHEVTTESRHTEDLFDNDGARNDAGRRRAQVGNDWQQRGLECMAENDFALWQTLCTRRANKIAA